MDGLAKRDAQAILSWRAAVSLAALVAVFQIFGQLDFPGAGAAVRYSRLAVLTWELALLAYLIPQRRRPRLGPSLFCFGIAPLPLLVAFWLVEQERSMRGLPVELFFRENFMSVLIAAMTPPIAWISLVAIGAFTVQNVLLFVLRPIPLVPEVTRGEPWVVLFIGTCSVLLAFYRAHRTRSVVELIVMRERAVALERLTRSFVAVRDFANTPLQTLEVATSLLAVRCPQGRQLLERMARAVARLRGLNHLLDGGHEALGGPVHDSFDAVQWIGGGGCGKPP
jgi:hypothetical protein